MVGGNPFHGVFVGDDGQPGGEGFDRLNLQSRTERHGNDDRIDGFVKRFHRLHPSHQLHAAAPGKLLQVNTQTAGKFNLNRGQILAKLGQHRPQKPLGILDVNTVAHADIPQHQIILILGTPLTGNGNLRFDVVQRPHGTRGNLAEKVLLLFLNRPHQVRPF